MKTKKQKHLCGGFFLLELGRLDDHEMGRKVDSVSKGARSADDLQIRSLEKAFDESAVLHVEYRAVIAN